MFKTKSALNTRLVRVKGLEPPRLLTLEPKSSASANSATPACYFVCSLLRTLLIIQHTHQFVNPFFKKVLYKYWAFSKYILCNIVFVNYFIVRPLQKLCYLQHSTANTPLNATVLALRGAVIIQSLNWQNIIQKMHKMLCKPYIHLPLILSP